MLANWPHAVDAAIDRRFDDLVAMRRHLHMNPEPSGEERETSLMLYQRLGDEGFQVMMGPQGCGVVVDWGAGAERLALRGDIDALRIHDTKDAPYKSRCDGVMHACGHDAHTTLVFGAITAIADVARDDGLPWAVPLRGIFQPAEETCTGADAMIKFGALNGVGAIVATHMDPTRDIGHIGVRHGVLTANCDEVILDIEGKGGHAARPHEASDPIAAAAQLINALYVQIPRRTDSQDAVVVTIGQLLGGESANVIPEHVVLRGTVRTLCREVRDRTFEHIRILADGIGRTTDTTISVSEGLSSPSVINDSEMLQLLTTAARDVLGDDGPQEILRPSMGSEDFAYYLQEVPGAMIRVGCRGLDRGGLPLHNPSFDLDEEAIRIGAKILARTAVYYAEPNSPI